MITALVLLWAIGAARLLFDREARRFAAGLGRWVYGRLFGIRSRWR